MELSLCLSGGGARGVAHLGVIEKLIENHQVEFKAVSGTSAGSIIGAFIAANYKPKEILDILLNTDFYKHFRPSFSGGFIDLKSFRPLFEKYLPVKIEDLSMPFFACVTNLDSGKAEFLHQGNLFDSIIASSSIPLIFKPYTINEKHYVDGGILNNLPIEPLSAFPYKIMGINIHPLGNYNFENSVTNIAMRVIHITTSSHVYDKISKCDYYIEPNDIEVIGVVDYKSIKKAFDIGYAYEFEFKQLT